MIDLHLHTNHSDGADSVERLLINAENLNLEVISITDHDTIGAYKEIESNSQLLNLYSGEIIPGAELKAIYNGINIEVLAYGIDYNKLLIREVDVEKIQKENLEYFKEIAKKYEFIIDNSIYIDSSNPEKRWGAAVFSRELLKYPENIDKLKKLNEQDFFEIDFYRGGESNKNSIFYVDTSKYYPDINQVIEDIHNAGGLAFLAHAYIYPFDNVEKEVENILSYTKIDGIECEHSLLSDEQRIKLKELCRRYNKYMSGGSDYHGEIIPEIRMKTGKNNNLNISKEFIDDWYNKIDFKIK